MVACPTRRCIGKDGDAKDLFEAQTEGGFGIVEQILYYFQDHHMFSNKDRDLVNSHNGIKMAFHARQKLCISLDQWLV